MTARRMHRLYVVDRAMYVGPRQAEPFWRQPWVHVCLAILLIAALVAFAAVFGPR